jgi:hypothetical protein
MTITRYEEAITEQSQHIIESDAIIKPFLDEIEDLDDELQSHNNKAWIPRGRT